MSDDMTRALAAKGGVIQINNEITFPVDPIEHVVKGVGPEHVGLGSDFDGASMPLEMDDVSKLPRLTEALLEKGYREEDIEEILGGNHPRVMEQVERVAASLR